MTREERIEKRDNGRRRTLQILQRLFAGVAVLGTAAAFSVITLFNKPKAKINELYHLGGEFHYSVEIDQDKTQIREGTIKIKLESESPLYESYEVDGNLGLNEGIFKDVKVNEDYTFKVDADWGYGVGTIIYKHFTPSDKPIIKVKNFKQMANQVLLNYRLIDYYKKLEIDGLTKLELSLKSDKGDPILKEVEIPSSEMNLGYRDLEDSFLIDVRVKHYYLEIKSNDKKLYKDKINIDKKPYVEFNIHSQQGEGRYFIEGMIDDFAGQITGDKVTLRIEERNQVRHEFEFQKEPGANQPTGGKGNFYHIFSEFEEDRVKEYDLVVMAVLNGNYEAIYKEKFRVLPLFKIIDYEMNERKVLSFNLEPVVPKTISTYQKNKIRMYAELYDGDSFIEKKDISPHKMRCYFTNINPDIQTKIIIYADFGFGFVKAGSFTKDFVEMKEPTINYIYDYTKKDIVEVRHEILGSNEFNTFKDLKLEYYISSPTGQILVHEETPYFYDGKAFVSFELEDKIESNELTVELTTLGVDGRNLLDTKKVTILNDRVELYYPELELESENLKVTILVTEDTKNKYEYFKFIAYTEDGRAQKEEIISFLDLKSEVDLSDVIANGNLSLYFKVVGTYEGITRSLYSSGLLEFYLKDYLEADNPTYLVNFSHDKQDTAKVNLKVRGRNERNTYSNLNYKIIGTDPTGFDISLKEGEIILENEAYLIELDGIDYYQYSSPIKIKIYENDQVLIEKEVKLPKSYPGAKIEVGSLTLNAPDDLAIASFIADFDKEELSDLKVVAYDFGGNIIKEEAINNAKDTIDVTSFVKDGKTDYYFKMQAIYDNQLISLYTTNLVRFELKDYVLIRSVKEKSLNNLPSYDIEVASRLTANSFNEPYIELALVAIPEPGGPGGEPKRYEIGKASITNTEEGIYTYQINQTEVKLNITKIEIKAYNNESTATGAPVEIDSFEDAKLKIEDFPVPTYNENNRKALFTNFYVAGTQSINPESVLVVGIYSVQNSELIGSHELTYEDITQNPVPDFEVLVNNRGFYEIKIMIKTNESSHVIFTRRVDIQ